MLSCPYFLKNVHSVKKHTAVKPIFCRKTSILSKTRCSHFICFKFSWKTPAVMPIFGHKSLNSVKTTLYYRPKKSIGYPFFFPIFHKKILLSCPYFVKKHPFLKNTQLSCPYFVKKTSILSKILCSHAFFFKFFI